MGFLVVEVGGGIARGVDSRRAVERVNFEAGIVGQNQFSGNGEAIFFGFLASVRLEVRPSSTTVGREEKSGMPGDCDAELSRGSGEIPQFAGV